MTSHSSLTKDSLHSPSLKTNADLKTSNDEFLFADEHETYTDDGLATPSSDTSRGRVDNDNAIFEVDSASMPLGCEKDEQPAKPLVDGAADLATKELRASIVHVKSSQKLSGDASSFKPSRLRLGQSIPIKLKKTSESGRYVLEVNDPDLRDILRKGLQRESKNDSEKRGTHFRDLVFTKQFTAFDRQYGEGSLFRGFYTLFWMATFFMLLKIAAANWRNYGSIFGRHEILSMMFHRDVLLLGITDGVLCGSTVFCLLLQLAINAGYLTWNHHGWIVQHVSFISNFHIDIQSCSYEDFP